MHYCISCGKYLEEAEFHANNCKSSGLQDHCKKHQIEYARQYYAENSKIIIKKQLLRQKFKSGKINKDTYEKEFKKLTGKEPRTNTDYTKKIEKEVE